VSKCFYGQKEKIEIQCQCGNVFKTKHDKLLLRKKQYCNECSLRIKSGKRKTSNGDVRKHFSNAGLKLLSDEYVTWDSKMECEDSSGYKGMMTLPSAKNGSKIEVFHFKNPFLEYNLELFFKIQDAGCRVVRILGDKKTTDKVEMQCKCGNFYTTILTSIIGQHVFRCPSCSKKMSSFECKVERYLIEHDMVYKRQAKFSACKHKATLPFDFIVFIAHIPILIEVDGQSHFFPIYRWAGDKGFEQQKIKDNIKNQFATECGIRLIRIPYWDIKSGNYVDILDKGLLGNSLLS
jgi:hypothetical protein